MNIEEFLIRMEKPERIRFRLISENANDIITVINEQGEILYLNEAILFKTLNLSYYDVINRKEKLIHEDDAEFVENAMMQLFNIGTISFEARVQHASGNYLWFDIKGKRYFKHYTYKAVLIARDITERKRAERKLKGAYERENFYKKVFTHDMNNILNNIQTSTSLLNNYLTSSKKPNNIDEIIMILNDQVKRGKELIMNISSFSKLEEYIIPFYEIDPELQVRTAIKSLLAGFPNKRIKVIVDTGKIAYKVRANEFLSEIFENLLINAVRHNSNDAVKIWVKFSKIEMQQSNWIKMEFIDNGVGVPDSLKEIIFKGNFSPKLSTSHSMGIGLSLVKQIIKSYKGKIWVEDRVEGDYSKGSNFIICLASE